MATYCLPRNLGPGCLLLSKTLRWLRRRISDWQISIASKEMQRRRNTKCRSIRGCKTRSLDHKSHRIEPMPAACHKSAANRGRGHCPASPLAVFRDWIEFSRQTMEYPMDD